MTRQKMFSRFQLLDPIEVLLTSRPHKGGEKGVVTLRPRILANPSCNARIHGRIFEKKIKKGKVLIFVLIFTTLRYLFRSQVRPERKWKIEESFFYNYCFKKEKDNNVTTKRLNRLKWKINISEKGIIIIIIIIIRE